MTKHILEEIDNFFIENMDRLDLSTDEVTINITVSKGLRELVEKSTGKVVAVVDSNNNDNVEGIFMKDGFFLIFKEYDREGRLTRWKETSYAETF